MEFLKDASEAVADREAQRLIAELTQARDRPVFDLIDDYLTWIAFRAISPVFGEAADKLAVGAGDIHDQGLTRQYFMEIRYVAGQLLGGRSSPIEMRGRAELCGDALRARVRAAAGDIRRSWNVGLHPPRQSNEMPQASPGSHIQSPCNLPLSSCKSF